MVLWTDLKTGVRYGSIGRIPALGDICRVADGTLRRVCTVETSFQVGSELVCRVSLAELVPDCTLVQEALVEAEWNAGVRGEG